MLLFLIFLIALAGLGIWASYRGRFREPLPEAESGGETAESAPSEAETAERTDSEPKSAEDASGDSSAESDKENSSGESSAEELSSEAEQWKQESFETGAESTPAEDVVYNTAIPEEIRAFVAKYPEAAEFAANFEEYSNQHLPIDITPDVAEGGLPMFLQWDARWAYEMYGGGYMGIRGCGPTCLSMVISGLTGHTEWNPYRMAQYAEENGYYLDGVGTEWGFMQRGATNLGLNVSEVGASSEGIRKALESGEPVICAMGPGDFTYSGHFIVLCDIDSDGNITIHDPNSRVNSEKLWTAAELIPQIKALWSYRVAEVPEEELAETTEEELTETPEESGANAGKQEKNSGESEGNSGE